MLNGDHTGDIGEPEPTDHQKGVRDNADNDCKTVQGFAAMHPTLPEIKKLRQDLAAAYTTRLDAETALLKTSEPDPPDVDAARAAMAKMDPVASALQKGRDGVSAFCH